MTRPATAEVLPLHARTSALVTPNGATTAIDGDAIVVHAPDGQLVARYDTATGELMLSARAGVTIAAKQRTLTLEADELRLAATKACVEVEEWEVRAERIVERAVDVFRTVEGVAETHARRLRMVVERTLELTGRRTSIVSKEDTRIDGKRVLLG